MAYEFESIRYFASEAATIVGDMIWASCMNYNGLYCWKLDDSEAMYMGEFPEEAKNEWRLHSSASFHEGKLYFLPDRSRYIHIYDIEKEQFSKVELYCKERFLTRFSFSYDKYIVFALGHPKSCICMLDTRDNRIQYFFDDIGRFSFSEDFVLINDTVWFVPIGSNSIKEFSLTNRVFNTHVVECNDKFFAISAVGNDFFIATLTGGICWNLERGIIARLDGFPEGYKFVSLKDEKIVKQNVDNLGEESPFSLSFMCGNEVLLFPRRTNETLKMSKEGIFLSNYHLGEETNESLNQKFRITHCRFLFVSRNEKMIILFSTMDRSFLFFNTDTREFYSKRIFVPEPLNLKEYLFDEKSDLLCEDYYFGLSDFIKSVYIEA